MSDAEYFANHANKLRFPWRLYHRPIVDHLARAIAEAAPERVLNVGSGPFLELPELPSTPRYVACDIDPRAVQAAADRFGHRLEDAVLAELGRPLPFEAHAFDLVFACDVVEHVEEPVGWLRDLRRVLRPGGRLLLSTPNYGKTSTLSLIEKTVLEVVARRQGFSRKHIHPTPMTRRRLTDCLTDAGYDDIRIRPISLRWVLFSNAGNPG